eukprot:1631555-Prymnesium_polylepis.1
MLSPAVPSEDACAALLLKMGNMVSVYQPRLLKAIGASLDKVMETVPLAEEPSPTKDLHELCVFFGIDPRLEAAGEFGIGNDRMLYDARRTCSIVHADLEKNDLVLRVAADKKAGGEMSSVAAAVADSEDEHEKPRVDDRDDDGRPPDVLHVKRCPWLGAVVLLPAVP